jgi:hypothetical protein
VAVADVDRTARVVASAGGAVLVAPADTAVQGQTAVFTDPHCTRFGACRIDGRHQGVIDALGTFSWGELITDDVATSAASVHEINGGQTQL